jgi:hypothetical protein
MNIPFVGFCMASRAVRARMGIECKRRAIQAEQPMGMYIA